LTARVPDPALRARLADLLGFAIPPAAPEAAGAPAAPAVPGVAVVERRACDGYTELLVRYPGHDGAAVPAFLLVPDGDGPLPGVVVHHQHHSQFHLGKSEVAGRAGDPLQAFGPALARRGVAVLAPDAIAFEDRRALARGTEPHPGDGPQHHNAMSYRLVRGELLMTTVLGDAAAAHAVLAAQPRVDAARVGALGHSYGGNTTLFHAALDERVRFAAASGAACTYRRRMADRTQIELAQIVPGIVALADIDDVVGLIAPRPLLLVSATEDPYSGDADEIERAVGGPRWERLRHARYAGGHDVTPERFELIVNWVVEQARGAGG
jgi:dienelactone hydrolase